MSVILHKTIEIDSYRNLRPAVRYPFPLTQVCTALLVAFAILMPLVKQNILKFKIQQKSKNIFLISKTNSVQFAKRHKARQQFLGRENMRPKNRCLAFKKHWFTIFAKTKNRNRISRRSPDRARFGWPHYLVLFWRWPTSAWTPRLPNWKIPSARTRSTCL